MKKHKKKYFKKHGIDADTLIWVDFKYFGGNISYCAFDDKIHGDFHLGKVDCPCKIIHFNVESMKCYDEDDGIKSVDQKKKSFGFMIGRRFIKFKW